MVEQHLISLFYSNLQIQGTPGVGKSRICAEIAKQRSMKWQDVSKIAKENGFVEEYDEKLECPVLDEDEVSAYQSLIENQQFSILYLKPNLTLT